ncbi:hypothetical protein SAMN05421853_102357 [Roseivivax halotolerans]|uniref:Sulfotransferase family protein n=1 Tax=Roseivivax halotolerans TaxID=93684 RepID=A0A1I5WI35_9RHOB|nr:MULTISPECIES: hypothetical protein [Roseivivax]QFT64251.1 hypothetical protein FIU91_15030 [Roseivivax sp. THAF30]SFQ19198.1 hypothetical protein SAMN05421853_102357 [Roseivivax halotolerans]
MQVILHSGVHFTDEGRFLKAMQRNAPLLREVGVAIPGPSRYRTLLSEAAHRLAGGTPAPEAREVLLDGLLDEDWGGIDRIILSHPNFFSVPRLAMQGGVVYRKAEERIDVIKTLFAGDSVEVFLGLRDPSGFLHSAYREGDFPDFATFLDGADPDAFRWSGLIRRLRTAHPDVPLTCWCNEDTPIIWGQIIREAGGFESNRKVKGAFDLLHEIMDPEGMKRFRAYLHQHPTMTERQKRRVMVAFLDKYAMDEEIEEELDLPGWDEARVDRLSQVYEDDVQEIERMPGVTFIAP